MTESGTYTQLKVYVMLNEVKHLIVEHSEMLHFVQHDMDFMASCVLLAFFSWPFVCLRGFSTAY